MACILSFLPVSVKKKFNNLGFLQMSIYI